MEQWQKKVALGPGKQRAETWFGLKNRMKISKIINDYLLFSLLWWIIAVKKGVIAEETVTYKGTGTFLKLRVLQGPMTKNKTK